MSDDDLAWQLGTETRAHDYRVFTTATVEGTHPHTGARKQFSLIRCQDWVNVIALTRDDRIVMLRQFRVGDARVHLEVPGGLIEPGEDPAVAAARELAEETGYVGGTAELIGQVAPNPALQNNTLYTVQITGVSLDQAPAPDDGEVLAVTTATRADCRRWLVDGTISHALVMVAFAHLAFRGEL